MKRQKLIRILWLIAVLFPAFDLSLCIRSHYRLGNFVAQNIFFGNFLVVPFLFAVVLQTSFSIEIENDTLKNVLVTGIPRWKIFASKILAALCSLLPFIGINYFYTVLGGAFLRNYELSYVLRAIFALLVTAAAAVCATMPVVILVVASAGKRLFSLIAAACLVLFDFLCVWQLTLGNFLDLDLPILIAYRITERISIVDPDYSLRIEALRHALEMRFYPVRQGVLILCITVVFSVVCGGVVYCRQEAQA